jgi:ubiquinone/menaquinone biosynthesis C-methylase UbiE
MLKLKKFQGGEPLVAAMAAVKMGDRLLVIGGGKTKVLAQLAVKPGLTGNVGLVDDSAERTTRAAAAAEREGALVEAQTAVLSRLPYDGDTFDVVVLNHLLPRLRPDERSACLREAARVVRGGGRCVAIQSARGGVARLLGGSAGMSPADVEAALSGWFIAVRTLAEREGLIFVEGVKRAE